MKGGSKTDLSWTLPVTHCKRIIKFMQIQTWHQLTIVMTQRAEWPTCTVTTVEEGKKESKKKADTASSTNYAVKIFIIKIQET